MANLVACPCPEQLKAIALGEWSEADAVSYIEHLERCANCAAGLSAMAAHDLFVEAIQSRETINDREDQQTVARLVKKMQSNLLDVKIDVDNIPDSTLQKETIGGATMEPTWLAQPAHGEREDDGLAPPQTPDEIGRLGPYRVLKVLGHGGMGKVFLAEDLNLQRSVALKVMKPTLARIPIARQRFLREARLAASLEHDNIVPIYQVGEDRGIPYIAMQLLKGESLEDRLRRCGTLTIKQAIHLGIQIAEGLTAAHERSLIHRDIKPGNIWIEPTGSERARILDFGLARSSEGEISITQVGTILGTPAYMSPEQVRSEKVDHRSDLYSLGCVLYRMTTGDLPIKGNDTMSMLMALAVNEPTAPGKIAPSIPPALSLLIMQLLAKNPNQRIGSAREVVQSLKVIERSECDAELSENSVVPSASLPSSDSSPTSLSSEASTVAIETKIPAPQPASRRRFVVLAVVGLLALIGILFGGQIFRVVTNQGELVLEIDDPTVEVKVVQNGMVVEDTTSKRTFMLTAGKGEIEVMEKNGVKRTTRPFELTRGGKTTVKVTLQEPVDARQPNVEDGNRDPDRRAAEWVLSIGGKIRVRLLDRRESMPVDNLPEQPFELSWVHLFGGKKVQEKVTDAGLSHFKGCNNLTYLFLKETRVSDAGMVYFKECKNLSTLHLGGTKVTDTGMVYFKDCADLTSLSLDETEVSDRGLEHFKDCKNLTNLNLRYTKLSNAGLEYFKDCKELTTLSLGGTRVNDAGLAHLKECKNLTELQLDDTQISDAGLVHLKEWTQLSLLNFHKVVKLSDAGLVHLKECENLTNLTLSSTLVTDNGLIHLVDCKNLKYLTLEKVGGVSDVGLEHLARCSRLEHLSLAFTQVTEAGVNKLATALPRCRIIWTGKMIEPKIGKN